MLIAWTDGELHWDSAAADFDWVRTTCLPARLRGAFRGEPLHLDVRWARTADDLSPRKPEFLDAVARLSSVLRGQPLDDLIGEDVRQHRRTRRLAMAAVGVLAAMLIAAIVAALAAIQQRNLARAERVIAEEQPRAEPRAAAPAHGRATDCAALTNVISPVPACGSPNRRGLRRARTFRVRSTFALPLPCGSTRCWRKRGL